MVMYTTLIFRIDNDDLSGETIRFFNVTANHRFYAIALEVLLTSTAFAVAAAIGCPSRVQKAQRAIAKLTKKSPATLEQGAKTSQARDRIRAAATAVLKSQSSLQRLSLVAREAANAVLAVEAIFEELDSKSAPTGTITPDEITGWWASAEPPDKFDAKSGQPQAVTSYSRVDSLRKTLDELISTPGERMDRDDFEGVLEILLQEDFEEVSDSSTGKVHYLNKVNRKTRWTLPSVGDWLTELHNATPPQLKLPESAATATSGPASVQRQDTNQGVEANPLFQQGGTPADAWQERHSVEHGGRSYWLNTHTRQTQWERPTEAGNQNEIVAIADDDGPTPEPEPEPQQLEPEPELVQEVVPDDASLEVIRDALNKVAQNQQEPTARAELEAAIATETERNGLLKLCARIGVGVVPLDAIVVAEIFAQVDTDDSGTISFEQFAAWWLERQLATQGTLDEKTMDEMYRVWDECDEDDNGELDPHEFDLVLTKVAESEWERAVDPKSQRPYFYHKTTKETRWVAVDSAQQVADFLRRQGIEMDDGLEL